MPATGLTKATKEPVSLTGAIYLGTVTRVDYAIRRVWVQIQRLAGGKTFGPIAVMGVMPNEGNRVACTFMENSELIVLGVLQQVAAPGPVFGGLIVQEEPPEATQEGMLWYDLNTAQEYVSLDNGSGTYVWVQLSGGSGEGTTSNSETVVDLFTSSGTWTKPLGAKRVMVLLVGGGGGAGSGRRGAAGTNRSGGAGGAAGGLAVMEFDPAELSGTVAVTVGVGGTGGVSQTADDSDGFAGTAGGATTFGAYMKAVGGAAGQSGKAGTTVGGANASSVWFWDRSTAQGAGGAGNSGLGGSGGSSPVGPAGGAGGGGLGASDVASNGGQGGFAGVGSTSSGPYSGFIVGGVGGVGETGNPGANGVQFSTASIIGGTGPGGGGAAHTMNAGAGGSGISGSGGAGGGGSTNGFASGAGGNGGNGFALIVTYR